MDRDPRPRRCWEWDEFGRCWVNHASGIIVYIETVEAELTHWRREFARIAVEEFERVMQSVNGNDDEPEDPVPQDATPEPLPEARIQPRGWLARLWASLW